MPTLFHASAACSQNTHSYKH